MICETCIPPSFVDTDREREILRVPMADCLDQLQLGPAQPHRCPPGCTRALFSCLAALKPRGSEAYPFQQLLPRQYLARHRARPRHRSCELTLTQAPPSTRQLPDST